MTDPIDSYIPMPADNEKINKAFTYHPPQGNQADQYIEIRARAKVLAEVLTTFCPASRELSLALTNLEQAVMWANAAIARNENSTLS